MINREDISFLKVLQAEMLNQETDCQAEPRFWVLRQYEYEPTGEDWADRIAYIYDNGDCIEFKEIEVLIEHMKIHEFNGEEIIKVRNMGNLEEAFEYIMDNYNENGYYSKVPIIRKAKIIPNTLFLTKKAAQEHMIVNYYHYNETVHTYAMTAWRSPEVENLFRIIENLDLEELDRMI